MKRLLAILLSLMMIVVLGLSAVAEQGDASDGASAGQEMPEGASDGESAGASDGASAGQEMPEGASDGQGMPEGDGASDGASAGGSGGMGGQVEGQLGSWSMGGQDADSLQGDDYAYDAALFVTADGVDTEKSAVDRITAGTYDETAAEGIVVDDPASGHNGVIVVGTDYTISNATITLLTDADGTDTCDFSGKGAAIAVYGQNAHVTVENSLLHVSGVAGLAMLSDDGAVLTIRNSVCRSDGGTLYKDYLNTPDQAVMVAPPWVLGILGPAR